MDHDEGHLEEDFEFVGDELWAAFVEGFGAVAALEDESFALLGFCDLSFEFFDLA